MAFDSDGYYYVSEMAFSSLLRDYSPQLPAIRKRRTPAERLEIMRRLGSRGAVQPDDDAPQRLILHRDVEVHSRRHGSRGGDRPVAVAVRRGRRVVGTVEEGDGAVPDRAGHSEDRQILNYGGGGGRRSLIAGVVATASAAVGREQQPVAVLVNDLWLGGGDGGGMGQSFE